jgi:3-polyprenyl-4-hydroxybenzoate decarboxylase
MQKAAEAGAVIFPPVPSFFTRQQTLDELVTDHAGRILLRTGIDNDSFGQREGG